MCVRICVRRRGVCVSMCVFVCNCVWCCTAGVRARGLGLYTKMYFQEVLVSLNKEEKTNKKLN